MIIRNCSRIRGSYTEVGRHGCAEQGRGELAGLGAGGDAEVGEAGFQQAEGSPDGVGVAGVGLQPHDPLVEELVVGVVARRRSPARPGPGRGRGPGAGRRSWPRFPGRGGGWSRRPARPIRSPRRRPARPGTARPRAGRRRAAGRGRRCAGPGAGRRGTATGRW